jgi:hypothetical protein
MGRRLFRQPDAFRYISVSRALAKATMASARDHGAVAVEGYAMVMQLGAEIAHSPRQSRSVAVEHRSGAPAE